MKNLTRALRTNQYINLVLQLQGKETISDLDPDLLENQSVFTVARIRSFYNDESAHVQVLGYRPCYPVDSPIISFTAVGMHVSLSCVSPWDGSEEIVSPGQ
mmetsp:Transcript_21870/g.27903  ORF Transcript_21870/g.27903 Transcript_21870/m.27903 type:complete len:101 (+) Transcript_21870:596-898(+)